MATTLQNHALGLTWVERGRIGRTAHALRSDGRVWLIDPFDDEAALAAAVSLGQPAGVLQLLDRHSRDCHAISVRLGVPLLRLPDRVPEAPFEVVNVIRRRGWNELALWWPQERGLIVAEAVGTTPAFALGRRAGIHPMLRLAAPRLLLQFRPERLLVGHGETLESDAAAALDDAFAHSRADIARLVISLPKLVRG